MMDSCDSFKPLMRQGEAQYGWSKGVFPSPCYRAVKMDESEAPAGDTLCYVCTCYGVANLATADGSGTNETITSTHHDSPKYMMADKSLTNRIKAAPFKNHDDQELLLLESLVGRTTPFVVPQNITRTRSRYF